MFCYQCEQTAQGTACTVQGVCGKNPEVAALQDLLIYALMGLSQVAVEGRKVGVSEGEVNVFTCKACFSTLTNVDFDPERFVGLIHEAVDLRERLEEKVAAAGGNTDLPEGPAYLQPKDTREELVQQAAAVGLKTYPAEDPNILSLMHTALFGIKGVCAYSDHAQILGQADEGLYAFVHECLAAIQDDALSLDDWVGMALRCGEAAVTSMELLDRGNTATYGDPVPTKVPLGHRKGKAILISGHDLSDLE
ncbi:MAG TPA: hydroxylamine reductase, partial [Desulfosarcina sp.]|nr:hydroxylamine reductase [Desulfosarcina sp.]